ncbi:hypothetical protein [Saccharopolyspora hattusasensis]|uniref:hypothetical protein n=1 Tax=Saccharopolyspora hattusasensis TaxID=1128679 RepID=UPI003D9724BB
MTKTAADLDQVRSMTVIPPWSLAIVQRQKPTKNRPRNLAGAVLAAELGITGFDEPHRCPGGYPRTRAPG